MNPLAIIPTYITDDKSFILTCQAIQTLRETAPEVDIWAIDDCSPEGILDKYSKQYKAFLRDNRAKAIHKSENTGFSDTVNIGLEHALQEGKDAILINADMEFRNDGWMDALRDTDASITGALLTYSNGLVQHAGVFFSILRREHDHRYRMAPSTLSVVHEELECPVTGALMYIKHECLENVGLLDTRFSMGWEDVDYCIQVMKSGRKCVYQPKAQAVHHESMFRRGKETQAQKWFEEGLQEFRKKWAGEDMSVYCPTMIEWPE